MTVTHQHPLSLLLVLECVCCSNLANNNDNRNLHISNDCIWRWAAHSCMSRRVACHQCDWRAGGACCYVCCSFSSAEGVWRGRGYSTLLHTCSGGHAHLRERDSHPQAAPVQSWTKIVSSPTNSWELLISMPNFDTRRVWSR